MDNSETFGAKIRQFLRELFGSRLVERLELDLIHLRNDMDQQLHDKDVIIASLREEKNLLMSKVTMYEMTIMPHSSRIGADIVSSYVKPSKPSFAYIDVPPPKSRWQQVVEDHERQLAKEEEEEKKAAAETAKG